jgi:nucleotide-binding universal stress UspA family protein
MDGNFSKILALVDYSKTSSDAAEEAALIASKFNSELHLLHISSIENLMGLISPEASFFEAPDKTEEEYYIKKDKLEKLKKDLAGRYGIGITCFENRGAFIDVVNQHVKGFAIGLIVMGAKKRTWLREIFKESKARSVIKSVDCEVLCVYSGSKTETLKKIVLPVGESISKKKIEIAYELAKKFASKIYLISLNGPGKKLNGQSTKTLIDSYWYLKELTNIPIECTTMDGDNLARATMHYARILGADLILIDEGFESDLKIPFRKGNIVNHSSVPVMSIHSVNNGANTYSA